MGYAKLIVANKWNLFLMIQELMLVTGNGTSLESNFFKEYSFVVGWENLG